MSASQTVDSLCAITKVVRLARNRSMACLTFCSVLDVERTRRLVEDKNGRVLQDRACDGDTLALAARQFATRASPTTMSYPSVLERMKSLAAPRRDGGFMHLVIGRAFAAEPDVLFDRAVEQAGILEHRQRSGRAATCETCPAC